MKNKIKILLLVLIVSMKGFGQGESNWWYFGQNAGLHFPFAAPAAVTNGLCNTSEGSSSIADPAGNLLFYTDGITVWNKLHVVMANGGGLFGNPSSTQSGLIIKQPGNNPFYYIFTTAAQGQAQGLRYSIVDMSLAAGNGSVTVKNVLLQTPTTEKITGVRHCNNIDVWIVSHDFNTNAFRTFLLTSGGVGAPVISNIGLTPTGAGGNETIGQLKASPDGKKLGSCIWASSQNRFEVFDFNNSTGVITNQILFPQQAASSGAYGVEFSPNSNLFYGTSITPGKIYQWNLCAGNAAAIIASIVQIGVSANNFNGSMQLGPDGKIYVARYGVSWVGVINNPNTLGVGCGYVDNGVGLAGKMGSLGLPNFVPFYFEPPPPPFTNTVNCLNVSFTSPTVNVTNCSASANAITSYSWNFGDPASAPNNTSTIANPFHAFSGPGTFTVQLIIGYACGADTIKQPVTVISCSPMVSVNSPSLCSGSCAVLTATANGGTPPYTYTWTPNIGSGAGPYTVCPSSSIIYSVSITDANNVIVSNASTVTVVSTPTLIVATSSPTLCMNNYNGSTNTVSINASGATTYTWIGVTGLTTNTTAGSALSATSVPAFVLGTGSVVGTIGSCTSMATFSVAAMPNPIISVTSASMCFGTSATLTASGASSYVWSPSSSLSSSTGSMVVAVPSTTTVYSIIGASLNCMSATQTATVDVAPNPTVFITCPSPTICAGSSIALTANGANTYTWSPSGSLNMTNGGIVVATPWVNTVYSVIGTLNTCTASATQGVVVIPLPTLQAMCEKTVICSGKNTIITANGASSYSWSPGIQNSNTNQINVSPAMSTVYTLMGNNGICTATLAIPITVIPVPNLGLSTSNQKICFGKNTTLFASGAQNYIWEPNTGLANPSPNTALVTPSITTNYTVTGYNSSGTLTCDFTKEIEIEVVPQIIPTINYSVALCEGESTELQAGGSDTYFWMPSAGLTNAYIAQPFATPLATTVYTVDISKGGYCGITATVLVKVSPKPKVDAGPDVTFNLDEPMHLNGTGTGTLTWIAGEAILCRDCPGSQIMPTSSGCYQIQAVNTAGCKAVDEVCIDVTKDYNIYIPNIFTPNNDGLNDVFLVYGTGLNKFEMTVYDRWGEKLFVSGDQLKGWDGSYKGTEIKPDAYTYLINFTALDGKKHTKTGHVTLLK